VSGPAGERSLAALAARARDPAHALDAATRATLADLRAALLASDAISVTLGGRGGRLGEPMVATGLLEGFLLPLGALGKAGTPLAIRVDGPAIALFDADRYRARYWPAITVAPLAAAPEPPAAGHTFALDLHGAHDGPPALRVAEDGARRTVTCASFFRVGVREYAARGPVRRYADCVADLLALAPGSLDGHAAQPTLRLPPDDARFAALAAVYGLRPGVPLVVGAFQSAVVAKCYGHWRAVLDGIGAQLAAARPGAALDVLIACGPDGANPPGARYSDLAAEFAGYSSGAGALRAVVARTETLGDLACCLGHAALALTNDSAPGHIAGALGVPVVTPYLPGDVYSLRVWASSLAHHGVTSDAPYTRQQVENAVLWDHTDVIDSIPPARLVAPALAALAAAGLM
jgi:hypothetical protein